MRPQSGRRRKIEAEDLSLFGEALEDIFKHSNFVQKEVAQASGIADTTLSQMKVGVRLTRHNVRKILEGLIRKGHFTSVNFEHTANKLLELADEKPLNKEHKLDAALFELLCKLEQIPVKTISIDGFPQFAAENLVIAIPAIELIIAYEGENRYKVKKVLVK